MVFGGFENKSNRTPMAEINMIPLIDVMLVLLVIFIVTAPLLANSVKVELPKISTQSVETVPDKIEFAIRANGELYWNGTQINRSSAQQGFAEESKKMPQPEIHILADRHADYQFVAEALADASKAGLSKIGFITNPEK